MQNIESTIVELGQIFTQLAHMVREQEEAVQRYGFTKQIVLVNCSRVVRTKMAFGMFVLT